MKTAGTKRRPLVSLIRAKNEGTAGGPTFRKKEKVIRPTTTISGISLRVETGRGDASFLILKKR